MHLFKSQKSEDNITEKKKKDSQETVLPVEKGQPLTTQYSTEFNRKIERRIKELEQIGWKKYWRNKIYTVIGIIFMFVFGIIFVVIFTYITLDIVRIYNILEKQNQNSCDPYEVRYCPDGSVVSRIPPRCQFVKCPDGSEPLKEPINPLFEDNAPKINYDQLIEECNEDRCCKESAIIMAEGRFSLCGPEHQCPPNYVCNALKCPNSFWWCEPK